MDIAWIWIPVTILAAAFQVGRNVIQRRLVEELGTIGATQVRFLYGLPFAILLALGTLWITGADIPHMNMDFLIFRISFELKLWIMMSLISIIHLNQI